MKITYILENPDDASRGRATWRNAAIRVRCTEIAAALGGRGPLVKLLLSRKINERRADGSLLDSDIYVIFQTLEDHRAILSELLDAGKCVVVDVCDDVSGYIGNLAWSWENAQQASAVTVPTQILADRLAPKLDRMIHVVPDAVEGERQPVLPPRRAGPLRLFWYGWQHKIRALAPRLPEIAAFSREVRPVALTVMTNTDPIGGTLAAILDRFGTPLSIDVQAWSITGFDAALEASDIALVPYDGFLASSGRSPIKLMQAVWRGRLALSEDVEAYPEFGRFNLLYRRLADGLAWAEAHPDEVAQSLAEAQDHIAASRRSEVVAATWHRTLDRIATAHRSNTSGRP